MIEGTLIAESLRVGTTLEDLNLAVRRISRYQAQGTTDDQPGIWTVLDFDADESGAAELARAFADVLDGPGWYANFQSRPPASWCSLARSSATREATRQAGLKHRPTAGNSRSRSRSWTGRCEAQAASLAARRRPSRQLPFDESTRVAPEGNGLPLWHNDRRIASRSGRHDGGSREQRDSQHHGNAGMADALDVVHDDHLRCGLRLLRVPACACPPCVRHTRFCVWPGHGVAWNHPGRGPS